MPNPTQIGSVVVERSMAIVSGKDVAVWDWKAKKILQIQELDVAPLEVRWMHGPKGRGGFTNAAFGNSVWYWDDVDRDGKLEFHKVISLPDNSVPADMRVSYDNRYLYVSLWGGGKVQQYDIANPKSPRLVSEVAIPQANMMKLTPDSRRLYVTNSLLLMAGVAFGVMVFSPKGKPVLHIRLPERCANLCFGGKYRNRLFMVASTSVFSLYTNAQGVPYA